MAELDNTVTESAVDETAQDNPETEVEKEESVELARLRAELAKAKAATDKATKEAAEAKRSLRAKQSVEEAAAEEAKAQQQALQEELAQLRKEKAVGQITARAMNFIRDNDTSAQIAEYMYGAEDADAAIAAIEKAWTAREKQLRLEYGKIPAPGTGSSDGPTITKAQLDAMTMVQRVEFATKHPDEYNRLMGRA